MTHYLFFVGNNSSGKSNNLHVIEILAYRHVMSSNLNYANLLTCHGYLDEGQVTCSEDEADSLEEEPDKIRFHKNGYTKGGKVFKTEILRAGGRVQYPYKPFSWKCFAAEQLPDAFKARGFIQRIVELLCIYGKPECDITEVKNPAGDENLQKHLDELNDLRKLLFAYRLLHYHDPIPNINLDSEGIITRNKQLFKPVLKLFVCESLVQKNHDTYKELLPIIKGFVKEKRSKLNETFIAKLYTIIIELIKEKKSYKLSFSEIWQDIQTKLHGVTVPNKPTTLSFPDHDDVSQKMVGKTIREILHGIPIDIAHNEKGYAFDKEKLEAIGTVYGELGGESITLPTQEEIDVATSAALKQRELEQAEASVLEQQDREQMQQQLQEQEQTKNTNGEFVKSTIPPPVEPTMSTPTTSQKGEEQHNKVFWSEDLEGDCEGDA